MNENRLVPAARKPTWQRVVFSGLALAAFLTVMNYAVDVVFDRPTSFEDRLVYLAIAIPISIIVAWAVIAKEYRRKSAREP